jgi:polysaccharide biosynthesis transport protein
MLSNSSNSNPNNINNSNYPPSDRSREALDLNLTEYMLKVRRRWKPALAIFLLTVGITAILSVFQEKTFQAEGKLLFKSKSAAALTGVGGEKSGTLEPLLDNQTPLSTQIEVITSEPIVQQTIDRLKLQDNEGKPVKPEDLEKKLDIALVGGSDVIDISYKDANPKKASEVVNTLMDVYLQEQIKLNQSDPMAAKEFLNVQLPEIETKVSKAESELERFRSENGIVDLTEEKRGLVSDLSTLNQQISNIGSELQGTQAQTAALQSQIGLDLNQAVATNQLGGTPAVQAILGQLTTTESNLAQERQRFSDKHPSVLALLEKKEDLTNQLEELVTQQVGEGVQVSQGLLQNEDMEENHLERFISLKIQELSLQTQVSGLYQYQQAYLDRAKQLPRLEKQEQELLRQVDTAGKTYKGLLDSLNEVTVAQNQQSGNAQIVEQASIPDKGKSAKKPLLALGILLGVFLANLSVIILEMQDRTLQDVSEIKHKFPYKVLGITPLESPIYQGRVIAREEPDSFSSEVYRMIQANLKFLTADKAPKVILVTSSVPEEGKSTVTANLAAAIAQLGRRVLLVDGDLRRASQHRLWGVDDTIGLKDVLSGDRSLLQALSRPMPKLDLLPGGQIDSNPLALIDSPKMTELIASSRKEYDLILIDAPPLPVSADVLTLSKQVDGIVFVTRPGIVEHESAELAQETLETTGQRVLGMVINGVKPTDFDRYSYHARYGKSYYTNNQYSNRKTAPEGNSSNGTTSKANSLN